MTIVFEGLGIGESLHYEKVHIEVPTKLIDQSDTDKEKERYLEARNQYKDVLQKKLELTKEKVGEKESEIFGAHIEILEDPEFEGVVFSEITKELNNAVMAINEAKIQFVALFEKIDNPYIKERSKDLEDVSNGLMKHMLGLDDDQLASISKDTIIFAEDLEPSETIQLNQYVKGIVLQKGSLTSHSAIVAKAKGIPTVVGYEGETPEDQTYTILDLLNDQLIVNPDDETKLRYEKLQEEQEAEAKMLAKLKELEGETLDKHHVDIYANVGSIMEAEEMVKNGGFGIGLLRSELVYMNQDHWPTEQEQYEVYQAIAAIGGKEIIIRTLDIGGDKMLPYHEFDHEDNPFLGLRAIRFCLRNPEIFKEQLRAILRVSATLPVKIMFPMVSRIEELMEAKVLLEEAKKELKDQGVEFNDKIEVGIMVEIPSVVFTMDKFAKEVDFVSVGTNDLSQYTLAVDRMNQDVAYLYDSKNLSVLRMIQHVVKECHKSNVIVGVCGEVASDIEAAKLLVGMGVDELSMSPAMIPRVKHQIRNSNYKTLVEECEAFLA